ncbi:hypothetical protein ESA94_19210 [Lacibacter luteus]|uniref:Thioredoxin n=1 Tax=Lacibacter luteus TaxID=2508719 RepID=A0A4Q1CEE2_9BACT|nr:rhodanese-like domain-containing protein [Lacibacter luteus]RXK58141.1 hypothetical protein ESA94_19210 [Lacibacter luteus]
MRFWMMSLFVLLMACNSGAQEAKEIPVDEFEKGLAQANIQLLDVRTAGEYRSGHLKTALQANWNDQKEFTERTASLDKEKTVYIYCLSGGRSHAAAEKLRANGYKVVEMSGGFNAWKRNHKPVEGASNEKQMTMDDYQQQLTGKEYVLVDFGAEWCPPCRKMEPIVNNFLAANKSISFFKIDGGVHTDLMNMLNIDGLPTFILLKNGMEVWRYKGVLTAEELNAVWQSKKTGTGK